MKVDCVDTAGSVDFIDSKYYAFRKLSEQQFIIGAVNLLGEQPRPTVVRHDGTK